MGFPDTMYYTFVENRQAANDYLQNQNDQIQAAMKLILKIIWSVRISAIILVFWIVCIDQVSLLSRSMFIHIGDGTVYFQTVDPFWIGCLLLWISVPVLRIVTNVLMSFTGCYRNYMAEYFCLYTHTIRIVIGVAYYLYLQPVLLSCS